MTTLTERESAFEAKFAHDEEFRFLATARRDKLFAAWASDRSGLDGPTRAALIASVYALPNGANHDALLLETVERTLGGGARQSTREELVRALESCGAQARLQLVAAPT